MTNEDIVGWMVRHMGPEADPIFEAADAAFETHCRTETKGRAAAARRAQLELGIIVAGGLPVIERLRHAV